jgi:3'(2'), 5'-bisphosphate nucleotidase
LLKIVRAAGGVKSEIPTLSIRLAEIAQDAGRLILNHYAGFSTARAKADSSPVTAADEEAEALILDRLKALAPDIPVIAEEAMAAGRMPEIGARFFLVDPLDGTKEFLQKNGEFTVNIALIEGGKPVAGVVLAPAKERAFVGEYGRAFEIPAPPHGPLAIADAHAIHARPAPRDGLIAIASRTHRDSQTDAYLAGFTIAERISAGSSLKFCLVAAGEADLYPRHGPTMEWDTAAGQAVLEAAGGSVTQFDGMPLRYGKIAAGFRNPFFVAKGLPQLER